MQLLFNGFDCKSRLPCISVKRKNVVYPAENSQYMQPTEAQRAWMGGFIDGEGSIFIGKNARKDKPTVLYKATVTVSNTRIESLRFFQRIYGGSIYTVHEYRRKKRLVNWQDTWRWTCPMSLAEKMLNDILPYLVIKHEQARIVLQFLQSKDSCRKRRMHGNRGGSLRLSDEEVAFRDELYRRCRLLNKTGIK